MVKQIQKCAPCEGEIKKYSDEEVQMQASQLIGWTVVDQSLQKKFTFRDFAHLMLFVNQMAEIAENMKHHPDFSVHYNELQIKIYTHSLGGLTQCDFQLAEEISLLREKIK